MGWHNVLVVMKLIVTMLYVWSVGSYVVLFKEIYMFHKITMCAGKRY